MKHRTSWLAAALIVGAGVVHAADPKTGQWEYEMEMTVPGAAMPQGMQMPELPEGVQLPPGMTLPKMSDKGMTHTMRFKQCVTQDDFVPMQDSGDVDCKMLRQERKGDQFSWAAECQTPQGPAYSEGRGTYTGERMDAVITSKTKIDGKPMEMTQNIRGRYLGPCP